MATAPLKTPSPRAHGLAKELRPGPGGGFAREPYDDGGAALVIGWGHRLYHGEGFTQPIGRDMAERLLAEDLARAGQAVAALNLELAPHEFDALALLALDLGAALLASSTLVKCLRRERTAPTLPSVAPPPGGADGLGAARRPSGRDPEAIARQWQHWASLGQVRLPALAIRRACELMLFQGAPDAAIADERARLEILAARGKL